MNKIYYREQVQKETEEKKQHILAAQKGCTRENIKNQILNGTPDEMQGGLEKTRTHPRGYRTKLVRDLTPEELENRRRMGRERWKNMTEEQRKRKRELSRLADIKRRKKETPEQRAERQDISATYHRRKLMQMTEAEREARLERRRCSASKRKLKSSGECSGTQLEHETPGAVLTVSDESMDTLDVRNSFIESDKKVFDSNAVTDQTTKSNSKESECSMTLAEKWGLRPLVVRLVRIDVAEIIQKIKQESALNDDSAAV